MKLEKLVRDLYAHTTMTVDDILFIAKENGITIDGIAENKITARKDNEEVTFDVVTYEDGTIFIFDIE